MSRRLVLYVGSVVAVAIVLLALFPLDWRSPLLLQFLGWVLITIVAESLWLPTITGEGTDSMASAANFATVVLWGVTPSIWIVALSTALSDLLIRRRPGIRVLFNAAAMVIVMTAAGWVFALLGGPREGIWPILGKAARFEVAQTIGLLIPLLGLGIVYRTLNVVLVSIASGWGAERPILLVMREDFLYAEQIISDLALLFLSPLMVVSYAALSYPGIILFYVPLLVIHDSHRRYVELKKAQDQIIHTERMAAKGEMAAEIGHEISQLPGRDLGRAQMLTMELRQGRAREDLPPRAHHHGAGLEHGDPDQGPDGLLAQGDEDRPRRRERRSSAARPTSCGRRTSSTRSSSRSSWPRACPRSRPIPGSSSRCSSTCSRMRPRR